MTVTGTSAPSSANTWVIPTFLPMIPSIAIVVFFPLGTARAVHVSRSSKLSAPSSRGKQPPWLGAWSLELFAECLDLHVHTRRQLELHERVDGLRRRLQDVEQPLVRPHLELLARLLVDVRRAEDRVARHLRRQGDRSRYSRTG